MLRLGRRTGQSVIITTREGDRITVTLCSTEKGKAVIGFEAHPDVTIDREEVDNDKTRRKAGGP